MSPPGLSTYGARFTRALVVVGLCFLPAFFLIGIVPTIIGAFSSFTW